RTRTTPSSRCRGWRRRWHIGTCSSEARSIEVRGPRAEVGPRLEVPAPDVRILYLADIRFPLERANGIQSMETCHALAARGHEVTLVVRPDTDTPARDPFAFYGLPRTAGLHIEVAPITGTASSRRVGYLTFA